MSVLIVPIDASQVAQSERGQQKVKVAVQSGGKVRAQEVALQDGRAEVRFDVDSKRHYFWRDVYIKPAFRGQGRIQQIFFSWVRSLGKEGVVKVYTEVDPSNLPSLQAHRRLGFADIGSLFMLCVLGARFCFYRGPRFPSFQFRFLPYNLYVSPQKH